MKEHIQQNEWLVIEEGFIPEHNRVSESLFSLGNGQLGIRGNFEEFFSGDSLPGAYIGGIHYPEPLPSHSNKQGLPRYFSKMPNAANWIGIRVEIDGEPLDLAECELYSFRRILDMRRGFLERSFHARMHSGKEVEVKSTRFCSVADTEISAIRYAVTPVNFSGTLTLTPSIDLNVQNEERLVEEHYWVEVETQVKRTHAYLVSETRGTEFQVCTGMKFAITQDGQPYDFNSYRIHREKYVACSVDLPCQEEQETVLFKYVANLSSLHHPKEGLLERCKAAVKAAAQTGYDALLESHSNTWAAYWEQCDVEIKGDTAMQQGLRFNIFHLLQAYNGKDQRLSISPKGFTGERYGGCTFWSAETFCLPFFQATRGTEVARQLLLYRHNHLEEAIANAEKLGFRDGAALYPMITINGEESSTEWETALEAIHRNGAIAYAIFDYVRYTGDRNYLLEFGMEQLIAIARFWAQRVHWSDRRKKYVLHGVTGPNEYEANVNNNWYTNYLAAWCLKYTMEVWQYLRTAYPEAWKSLSDRLDFYEYTETNQWQRIVEEMHLPWDEQLGIFPQQDGYLEKNLPTVDQLKTEDRPIYRNWSWDRILRSGYVKRADVLQGLFSFEAAFRRETLLRNFEHYEARTVHESSLSAAVHAILAARLGKENLAYTYLRRSARLDLENYNGDTAGGCHVTSMGGTWMALVKGIAGMQVAENRLSFAPFLPRQWEAYHFRLHFRERPLVLRVTTGEWNIENKGDSPLEVLFYGKQYTVPENNERSGALETADQ